MTWLMQGKKLKGGENGVVNRKALNREKRIALQQDVNRFLGLLVFKVRAIHFNLKS